MYQKALAGFTQNALAEITSTKGKVDLLNNFYLAGGTALALQTGHRISIDLDFFSKFEFNPEVLISKYEAHKITLDKVRIDTGTLKFKLKGTEMSFFYYPYDLLEDMITYKGINIAGIRDIGCMKLTAISSRGSKKDFFDLYSIFHSDLHKNITLSSLFSDFEQKFSKSNYDKYHFLKSLTYFENADDDPPLESFEQFTWKDIKDYFRTEVTKLF